MRQIPFDLGHEPGLSRDNFITSPENRPALDLLDAWPRWPAPLTVLVGPPGSGKTHLAAIFAEQAGSVDARIEPDAALNTLAEGGACHIDDADCDALEETTLFHLINAARGGNGTLLLTAQRAPADWNVALADLRSRLRAATLVQIGTPGERLLETVFLKLFADRQIGVDPAVAHYVVRRIDRSFQSVSETVERLDRAALAGRRPITRALASEVLDESGAGGQDV